MPKEPTVMAVHHSFIYSNKYECYVDCTPGNEYLPAIISISYLKN